MVRPYYRRRFGKRRLHLVRIASQPVQKGGVGEAWAEAEVEAEVEAEDNDNHQQLDQEGHQRQGHQPQKSQNQHHDQPQKRKNQEERRSSQNHQPQSKQQHGSQQYHMLAVRTCMIFSGSRKFASIVEGLPESTNSTRTLEIEMGLRG